MSLYQRLFAEIGKAWDLGYEDEPTVLRIVNGIKEELQRQDDSIQEKERRDVLDELCDVTMQFLQQHHTSTVSVQTNMECFSISKRVPSKPSLSLSLWVMV